MSCKCNLLEKKLKRCRDSEDVYRDEITLYKIIKKIIPKAIYEEAESKAFKYIDLYGVNKALIKVIAERNNYG